MLRIILCDSNTELTKLWHKSLPKILIEKRQLRIINDNFKNLTTRYITTNKIDGVDANRCSVVSPGNSFGFLGGGFDLALYENYGKKPFEDWVRSKLNHEYKPVGSLTIFDTHEYPNHKIDAVRYIQHIPTMITPSKPLASSTADNSNLIQLVFNTMWVALNNVPEDVNTIIIPGLCTGYAGVSIELSTKVTSFAITLFYMRTRISKDLLNKLIMIHMGNDYIPFYSKVIESELNTLGLKYSDLKALESCNEKIIFPAQLLRLL
ncbi:hypothetical protein TPHA_0C03840 [Tetrapisispora phaffii CBS 4417]|uniref:Macro domain-containing protein n=1 Tax=Tetrapisispora phaffii (strain ATCC 24235 / CBS 4417 / NBRC 1672 / NRRL Y-8282 / UCD 70-5) TaxID=1071381 RepID=G8BQM4_TETPH|nr:hypothetical protein TPHA_0C03840 [Tetrapisispora phaffii CBS 4417]CCE62536.1 hypothetical protein TPHA_0C03840 [Tetrapisispora phaffii CBS 4417]